LHNIKKHIAILLIGIFIFPLLFQPLHVLLHHKYHPFLCANTSFETVFVGESTDLHFHQTDKNERCPICDYHFSLNQLPPVIVSVAVVPLLMSTVHEKNISASIVEFNSVKSPRAPPVFA